MNCVMYNVALGVPFFFFAFCGVCTLYLDKNQELLMGFVVGKSLLQEFRPFYAEWNERRSRCCIGGV